MFAEGTAVDNNSCTLDSGCAEIRWHLRPCTNEGKKSDLKSILLSPAKTEQPTAAALTNPPESIYTLLPSMLIVTLFTQRCSPDIHWTLQHNKFLVIKLMWGAISVLPHDGPDEWRALPSLSGSTTQWLTLNVDQPNFMTMMRSPSWVRIRKMTLLLNRNCSMLLIIFPPILNNINPHASFPVLFSKCICHVSYH